MLSFAALPAWATPLAQQLDAVYLALGHGDTALAMQRSTALLAQVHEADAGRADALQARLDTLLHEPQFKGAEGQALHALIRDYARSHASAGALLARLDASDAYVASDSTGMITTLDAALAATPAPGAVDRAELHALEARAHVLLDGHLATAHSVGLVALKEWQALPGLRARWHETELYYAMGTASANSAGQAAGLADFEHGVEVAVRYFGADSSARLRLDHERSSVLSEMGRHNESLRIREDMYAVTRRRYGENSFPAAHAEAFVGADLQEMGDYPAARERYNHVQATLAQVKDAPAYDVAVIAANFGNLLQEMDETDAALVQYQHALNTWAGDPQATHASAVILANTGNTLQRAGRFDEAIGYYQRALALREQSDGKDSPGLAYSLEGLGSATLALSRYAESEQYYRRALDLRSRGKAPNHPSLGPLNFGLALTRWGQGDVTGAFAITVATAQHQQDMLAGFAADFSERQSVAYRDVLTPATALAVTLAAQQGDVQYVDAAWQLVMRERGLVARTQAFHLASARAQHDPALAQAWAEWRTANAALADAWLEPAPDAARMVDLQHRAEIAERALWQHAGPNLAAASQGSASVAELGKSLPADGLVLAYAEGLENAPSRQGLSGKLQPTTDLYAFALSTGAPAQLRRVGSNPALSAQAHAWYGALRDPQSDPAQLRRTGIDLRRQLLDPFVTTGASQHLFIVPEGELYRVSFAALPSDGPGYLIEQGMRVHTLAHERDLALGAPLRAASTTLLAGAPDFPPASADTRVASRATCIRAAHDGFAAIPNAARELDDLQTLLAPHGPGTTPQLMLGHAATKEHVLAALPGANVIHLATHGFSLDESCADAAPVRGVSLTSASAAANAASSKPSLSGLAFSGANVSSGSAPVGVLSAGELATLDLSRVDWIALSACDSGLGPIGRNEGVFGMRRALRLAGARTVVMSLWQVDDASTADLMQALYRGRFVEHQDVPTAMAGAMRNVLQARRAAGLSDHPYYWAAFIDEGGWR